MRLWIDDIRLPPDDSWTWAKTSAEAISIVSRNIIEEISFDHDLGGDDKAIYVADYIEELAAHGLHPPIKWRVHSDNPAGRLNLQAAMMSADKYWGGEKTITRRYTPSNE